MINGKSGILDRLVLNKIQRDAVEYDAGPQLVFAGAGTGKTRVLTAKIAWLIDRGMHPSRIFAATFTNKAANEMRERVEKFTGRPVSGMWIGTFHSLCVRILRTECTHIGFVPSFSIYDSSDQVALIKKVLTRLEIEERSAPPRQLLSIISRYKNRCILPEEAGKLAKGFYEQEQIRLYTTYQQMLREQQAMDFDDLLMQTVLLLKNNPTVLDTYRKRFDYILIDEYQDTNETQMHLVKLLAGGHKKLFAVGDDDQSIYGWRGAQVENILQFEQHFPGAATFTLEQNYRSTTTILDFANSAISINTNRAAKQLWTDFGHGEAVTITRYRDDRQEADDVVAKVASLGKAGTLGGEIAVLFRTNAQSRVFEEAFRKKQIPYVLVGGTSFYERAEIKDALAYLQLLVNPAGDIAFERIVNTPARGLGDKALEALAAKAAEKRTPLLTTLLTTDVDAFGARSRKGFTELKELFALTTDALNQGETPDKILTELLQLSGYMDMLTTQQTEEAEGRIENLNELLSALSTWSNENPDKPLSSFLEEVSLASDIDGWNNRENAVSLMTLHSAKGLEFGHVFLVGLEEGILPSRLNFEDDAKIEEERRLLYVGATRAMKTLACSHVDKRYRFGEVSPQYPSRFILDIDPKLFTAVDKTFDMQMDFFKKATFAPRAAVPQQRFSRADIPEKAAAVPKPPPPPSPSRYSSSSYDDVSQEVVQYRMGQHVRHGKYGPGKIVSISGFGPDMKVMVLFNDGSRKTLMAKFAKFETD